MQEDFFQPQKIPVDSILPACVLVPEAPARPWADGLLAGTVSLLPAPPPVAAEISEM